jgi:hypothetical protein
MKQLTASVSTLVILALVVVGIVVLIALGHPVPSILETIALVAVGGQAGAALPALFGTPTNPTLLVTPAPAAPVTALAIAPAPAAAPATVVSAAGVTSTYPPLGGE